MSTKEEKTAFALRLRSALNRSVLKANQNTNIKMIKGGADLARQFNLRHMSSSGVSPQAAHKWLAGQMMPTADKIRTLAEWLEVTEHWLHYGPPPEGLKIANQQIEKIEYLPSPRALKLIEELETLPEHQRYLIEELVKQFYRNIVY